MRTEVSILDLVQLAWMLDLEMADIDDVERSRLMIAALMCHARFDAIERRCHERRSGRQPHSGTARRLHSLPAGRGSSRSAPKFADDISVLARMQVHLIYIGETLPADARFYPYHNLTWEKFRFDPATNHYVEVQELEFSDLFVDFKT